MAYIFKSEFTSISQDNPIDWTVFIADNITSLTTSTVGDFGGESIDNFKASGNPLEISWHGQGKGMFDAIKSSSATLRWYLKDSTQVSAFEYIIDNPDTQWYVTVFRGLTRYWFGYLKPGVWRKINEDEPTEVSFDAVDILGLLKDINITDFSNDAILFVPGVVNIGVSGAIILKFRMGEVRTGVGALNQHKAEPTIIEFVYSILNDLDYANLPGDFNTVGEYLVAHVTGGQFTTQDPHAELKIEINRYIYTDFPTNQEVNNSLKALDVLRHIVELLNCRLFLYNGEYWLVQNSKYKDATTFQKNAYIKGASNASNPVFSLSTNIISNTSMPVTTDPTDDSVPLKNDVTEYFDPLRKVTQSSQHGSRGLAASDLKRIAYQQDVNVSLGNYGNPQEETGPYKVAKILHESGGIIADAVYQDPNGASVSWWDLQQLQVIQRLEARLTTRKRLVGVIRSHLVNILTAITYDSDTYLPEGLTLDAKMDEWRGSWFELNFEIGGSFIDDGGGTGPDEPPQANQILTDEDGAVISNQNGDILTL